MRNSLGSRYKKNVLAFFIEVATRKIFPLIISVCKSKKFQCIFLTESKYLFFNHIQMSLNALYKRNLIQKILPIPFTRISHMNCGIIIVYLNEN